jgi:hypothetical protein
LTVGRPLHNTRRVRVSLIEVEHDPTGERQTYPAVRPGDEHVYACESDVKHFNRIYKTSLAGVRVRVCCMPVEGECRLPVHIMTISRSPRGYASDNALRYRFASGHGLVFSGSFDSPSRRSDRDRSDFALHFETDRMANLSRSWTHPFDKGLQNGFRYHTWSTLTSAAIVHIYPTDIPETR